MNRMVPLALSSRQEGEIIAKSTALAPSMAGVDAAHEQADGGELGRVAGKPRPRT